MAGFDAGDAIAEMTLPTAHAAGVMIQQGLKRKFGITKVRWKKPPATNKGRAGEIRKTKTPPASGAGRVLEKIDDLSGSELPVCLEEGETRRAKGYFHTRHAEPLGRIDVLGMEEVAHGWKKVRD